MKPKQTESNCNCGWCVNIAPLYDMIYEKIGEDVMSITNQDLQNIKENLLKIEEFHSADYDNVENAIVLLSQRFQQGNN